MRLSHLTLSNETPKMKIIDFQVIDGRVSPTGRITRFRACQETNQACNIFFFFMCLCTEIDRTIHWSTLIRLYLYARSMWTHVGVYFSLDRCGNLWIHCINMMSSKQFSLDEYFVWIWEYVFGSFRNFRTQRVWNRITWQENWIFGPKNQKYLQ